ncbi:MULTISPECIES: HNH endonuclease signature motif containing protein [unclassified Brevibacterium]|uniref:HNH endonuclease signature motif containing protein n=1 Tax=unclassified Brevibacterium TaxID=2614124 RepID=UPI001E34B3DE|nr:MULTISPECIES: HNH endonuclease signature motif containing protein [unclassified Brevibacterium]MCD1284381.1 hypothetical protein [Brevibacterium sp. CCUG 69071]MDK8436006.1 HNH endonuclease signature motif containing protein [Brevibacterium sp. H-BE7]
MKGITPAPTDPPHGDAAAGPSPRYTIRFESNVTRLAEAAAESDRAQFAVLEQTAGIILEQVMQFNGCETPQGDDPYRCETIAAAVARCAEPVEDKVREVAASPWDPWRAYDAEGRPLGSDIAEATDVAETTDVAEDAEASGGPLPDATAAETLEGDAPATDIAGAEHPGAHADATEAELPAFPDFDLRTCFYEWVHENVLKENLVEVSSILGTATPRTYRHLTHAMTIIIGLPRFADRVHNGEFAHAHVESAANLCDTVAFGLLPQLDEFLATRKAEVTSESLRKSLRKKINLLEPSQDRSELAAKRRNVCVEGRADGSACMMINGPAAEIFASYHRIEAMARAVHGKNGSPFNLRSGLEIIDERSISALMYDIAIRPVPDLKIKVREIDPGTGLLIEREAPLLDDEGTLLFNGDDHDNGVEDYAKSLLPDTTDSAFIANGSESAREREFSVKITMPTQQWWLANQAATVVTVPFLTLTGDSGLPGSYADGTPVPAEVARQIAGRSKTLLRILTDPATGTPIDAKATSYAIPQDLRKAIVEQWAICTAPGCTRRAEKAEIDHVDPFFHLEPLKGGLTRFGNLQPLCKKDHALKTARRYSIRMPRSGLVEYEFKHGITASVTPPDQPVNASQALEFYALAHLRPQRWRLPESSVPAPPMVLELMPGESTIRAREAESRRAQELTAKRRRISQDYRQARAARRRLLIERMLDWENAVFQPCLPPGSDPLMRKQLPCGSGRSRRDPNSEAFWATDPDDPPPF